MTGCPLKTDPTPQAVPDCGGPEDDDHADAVDHLDSPTPERQGADSEIEPGAFRDLEELEHESEVEASVVRDGGARPEDDGTGVPSLLSLCERQVSKTVNVKTVVSALTFADQFCAPLLAEYCTRFIRM
jgi:hypothetical protein